MEKPEAYLIKWREDSASRGGPGCPPSFAIRSARLPGIARRQALCYTRSGFSGVKKAKGTPNLSF